MAQRQSAAQQSTLVDARARYVLKEKTVTQSEQAPPTTDSTTQVVDESGAPIDTPGRTAAEESAYKKRLRETGREFFQGSVIPIELADMIRAVCERDSVKTGDWTKLRWVDAVNNAGLFRPDPASPEGPPLPWQFDPAQLEPEGQVVALQKQLADALAELAALRTAAAKK